MMKRMSNLIVFFLFATSGFLTFARADNNDCNPCVPKPDTVCIFKSDLLDIQNKLCIISKQLKKCCKHVEKNINECCNRIQPVIERCCDRLENDIAICCDRIETDIADCCDRLEVDIFACCNEIINTATARAPTFDFIISTTQLNTGNTFVITQPMKRCALSEDNRLKVAQLHQSLVPLLNQVFPAMQYVDVSTLEAILSLGAPTGILYYGIFHLLTGLKRTKVALENFRIFIAKPSQQPFFDNPIEQGEFDQKLIDASNIIQQIYDILFNSCELSAEEKQILNQIQ